MPPEDHDHFEDQLAAALRHTGGAFEADRHTLVTGGEAHGRRIRRRRAAVAGCAAGVALVGLGAALLPGGAGGERRSVAAPPVTSSSALSHSPTQRPVVTGDDLVRTLKKLLPGGRFSHEEGRGTDSRMPLAQVVYDDGGGKAAVAVSLSRVPAGGRQAAQVTECPDRVYVPYDACTRSTLSDGSRLMVLQGYEYPDRRVDTKLWSADLVTRSGQHISVQEWNAAAEKGAPITRDRPPLSPSRLKALVGAREWRAAVDAIPVDPSKAAVEPGGTPPLASGRPVSGTLVSLLPKGLHVVSKSAADPGFGYLVLDDGRGASLVQVNVQTSVPGGEGGALGPVTRTLPDGTTVDMRQSGGDKGVEGTVVRTVDVRRPDGSRVVISAFNSGTQHTSPTRPLPPLTMRQLEAIATSPKWHPIG
ncbi:hypothetical protein [Streptomyces sp. NPDC004589]|uniref:hypothetical protein n=1 Tax=Streptomyces sp. NPDC004589 TaxID=3154553 RepID=UPI0033ADEFFB